MEYVFIILSFSVYAVLAAVPLFIVLKILRYLTQGKVLSRPKFMAVMTVMMSAPLIVFAMVVILLAVQSIDGQVCWQECFDVEHAVEVKSNVFFLIMMMWPFIVFYVIGAAICGFRHFQKFPKVSSQHD